jgi:hypothetical protein
MENLETLGVYQPSRVDNFKRAGGTFGISRLLYNAPQAHTYISGGGEAAG